MCHHCQDHHSVLRQSSLPNSPPLPRHNRVPFHQISLADWCLSKRLQEILVMFPGDMSLVEFSHLTPVQSSGLVTGSPVRQVSCHESPLVIRRRVGGGQVVTVTDNRMKEKVVVAINAARAARRQAEEVGINQYNVRFGLLPKENVNKC